MIRGLHWMLLLAAVHAWSGKAILLVILLALAVEWLHRRLLDWRFEDGLK